MRCLGRTETDRKITNEPWSSKQSLTEQRRPLFGVKGVVCPKKEKREQKLIKKVLTRAGIVRDVAYTESKFLHFKCPGTYCYPALRCRVVPFGWLSSVCSF